MANTVSLEKIRMRDFFDSAAKMWDTRSKPDSALLRDIVAAAAPAPGARILDVACGTGVMFAPLLETQPALLHGIDLSPEMARLAKERLPHQPALRVSCSDFYTFDETHFDLVMIFNAYPHFMDKAEFARRLTACLAPDGRFVIAHLPGRQRINACHGKKQLWPLSTPLLACEAEAERLGGGFCYDIMLDEAHCYMLSGRLA